MKGATRCNECLVAKKASDMQALRKATSVSCTKLGLPPTHPSSRTRMDQLVVHDPESALICAQNMAKGVKNLKSKN